MANKRKEIKCEMLLIKLPSKQWTLLDANLNFKWHLLSPMFYSISFLSSQQNPQLIPR